MNDDTELDQMCIECEECAGWGTLMCEACFGEGVDIEGEWCTECEGTGNCDCLVCDGEGAIMTVLP